MEQNNLKRIDLGIALDYAVRWNFEQILRDLIQNFYDACGYLEFNNAFNYSYEEENGTYQLKMEMNDHPFSYEWLLYLGGSTKSDSKKMQIGKYGEGFKICMLCLMKMGIRDIHMHSADWILSPRVYQESIDGQMKDMLGFQYERVADDGLTQLLIREIPLRHRRILEEALLHFFYPENPLLGKLLADTEKVSIYEASQKKVPCQQSLDIKGIIYMKGMARGRLPLPLFILVKQELSGLPETRRRETYDWFDCWLLVYRIACGLEAEESLRILEVLHPCWNDLPQKTFDSRTWYYVICQLVRNISRSEVCVYRFQEKYSDLAYIEREGRDKRKNALIKKTRTWAFENNKKRLVNPVFRLLGAESLTETFLKMSEEGLRDPSEEEQKKIRFLFSVADQLLPEYLKAEDSNVKIGSKKQAEMDPLRFAVHEENRVRKKSKMCRKYRIEKIVLAEEQFLPEAFEHTLVDVCSKLLQTVGSRRSNKLNQYMTMLGSALIMHSADIPIWKEKWETI